MIFRQTVSIRHNHDGPACVLAPHGARRPRGAGCHELSSTRAAGRGGRTGSRYGTRATRPLGARPAGGDVPRAEVTGALAAWRAAGPVLGSGSRREAIVTDR